MVHCFRGGNWPTKQEEVHETCGQIYWLLAFQAAPICCALWQAVCINRFSITNGWVWSYDQYALSYILITLLRFFFLQVWGDQLQWLINFQKSVKEIHKVINAYRCFPELGFSTLFKTLKFFIILVNFLYDAWLQVFCVFLLIWISGNLNFCVCITLLPAVFMQVKHSFKF